LTQDCVGLLNCIFFNFIFFTLYFSVEYSKKTAKMQPFTIFDVRILCVTVMKGRILSCLLGDTCPRHYSPKGRFRKGKNGLLITTKSLKGGYFGRKLYTRRNTIYFGKKPFSFYFSVLVLLLYAVFRILRNTSMSIPKFSLTSTMLEA